MSQLNGHGLLLSNPYIFFHHEEHEPARLAWTARDGGRGMHEARYKRYIKNGFVSFVNFVVKSGSATNLESWI